MKILSINNKKEWNNLVTSFKSYDVYYLIEYVEAFRLHGEGEPLLFYYESNDLRGIHVVMKRDIAEDKNFKSLLPPNTYFDVRTPYGYGGWIIEGTSNDYSALYKEYLDWCIKNHIICEFVRFSLFSKTRESYYGIVTPRTNNIVRSLDKPIEQMLMDFEHKVRKNLKHAISAGLQIEVDITGAKLNEFLKIYYSTMDRNDAEQEYYFKESFYKQINTMINHFVYFHVVLGGKVISTELVIMGSDTMYSYLGGTDSEYFAYRPNDFLKYHIIKWGIEHGYKQFVLGGGYGSDDGIFRYKKSFAPDGIIQFYTGEAIFDHNQYQKLVELRENLQSDSKFFPLYRA